MAVQVKRMTVTTTPSRLEIDQSDVKGKYSVIIKPVNGDIRLCQSDQQSASDTYPVTTGSTVELELDRGEDIFICASSGTVNVHVIAQGV